jgi:hypothetical protein
MDILKWLVSNFVILQVPIIIYKMFVYIYIYTQYIHIIHNDCYSSYVFICYISTQVRVCVCAHLPHYVDFA